MSVNLQAQIRDNSRDLNAFLRDLNEWTGDVKEKDAALSSRDARDVPASASSSGRAEPPPVRGRVAEHVVRHAAIGAAPHHRRRRHQRQAQPPLQRDAHEARGHAEGRVLGHSIEERPGEGLRDGDEARALPPRDALQLRLQLRGIHPQLVDNF